MPADWRDRLGEYLDWWDGEGFEVAPEHRRVLETWIEDWARARGVLPVAALDETYDPNTFAGLGSPRGAFDFILSQFPPTPSGMQIIEMLARDRRETIPDARPRKVIRVDTHLGIGAWYDEAIASGQYDPGFLARTAVAIVRPLFPDSDPTKIITYDDGTVEIILGGGPTSGAIGAQAAELAGLGGAAKAGRLLKELTETGFDVGVQEATGLPVGPSTIPRRGKSKSSRKTSRSKASQQRSESTSVGRREETGSSVPDRDPDSPRRYNRRLEYWTKQTEFEGHRVYQRDDLIDPGMVDGEGATNLERMKDGRAPHGPDGKSINIHHLLQEPGQPLAEVSMSFHRRYGRILHVHPNTTRSMINRTEFDALRRRYWAKRAKDFGGKP